MNLLIIGILVLAVINIILVLILLNKLSSKNNQTVNLGETLQKEFRISRSEASDESKRLREEISNIQKSSHETLVAALEKTGKNQQENLKLIEERIKELVISNEKRLEKLRDTVDGKLKLLQENNEKKLEQIRNTVDEKLQTTLEKRLGESFKQVSERLEAVSKGLGQMQNLATGVGDLKRMLTNVKTRGTWGEFQVGDILDQILTPEQFSKNVKPKHNSDEIVEFAINLPGQDEEQKNIWLPIDSKFPIEDYQRLLDASEKADADSVEKASTALRKAIEKSAKDISDKYIDPPYTTDFAILFLPTEGLYSEILRQPGLVEKIQQTYRVVVSGPTTLAAILNSLRMGFRTLAIEKRSSEVWKILSAVKTEFGKFGEVLSSLQRQLHTASNTIAKTGTRTRAMERKLRSVEALPEEESLKLLGIEKDMEISQNKNTIKSLKK